MLGKHTCKDPYHSTHYRKLPQKKPAKAEQHVRWLSTLGRCSGAESILLHKLEHAEQLLNGPSNLIDELKEELAEAQESHSGVQDDLVGMPESQLAAMQQQHTADMLHAVAEYMRQGAKSGGCHASSPEDSLAAMQRRQTVKLINQVTDYLRKDMQDMQQMCELMIAQLHPHRSLEHHTTRGHCTTPANA